MKISSIHTKDSQISLHSLWQIIQRRCVPPPYHHIAIHSMCVSVCMYIMHIFAYVCNICFFFVTFQLPQGIRWYFANAFRCVSIILLFSIRNWTFYLLPVFLFRCIFILVGIVNSGYRPLSTFLNTNALLLLHHFSYVRNKFRWNKTNTHTHTPFNFCWIPIAELF